MRRPLPIAASFLVLMAGCGVVRSGLDLRQAHRAGSVRRTFDSPVNRVLMAAVSADGDDFLFEDLDDFRFPIGVPSLPQDSDAKAAGSRLTNEELSSRSYSLDELYVGSGSIIGKTKDGRAVTLWLLETEPARKTEASVFIGDRGDEGLSEAFLDRIADRLAPPKSRPETDPKDVGSAPIRGADPAPKKGQAVEANATRPGDMPPAGGRLEP